MEVPSRAVHTLEPDKVKKIGGEHQETRSPTSSLSSGHDPLESPDKVTEEQTRSPTSSLSSVQSQLSPEPKDGSKGRKPSDSSSQSSVHSVSSDSIHSATGGEDITPVSASALQENRVTPSPTRPESTNDPIRNEKPSLASDPPHKGHEKSPAVNTDYSYEDEVFEKEEEEGLEPIDRDDIEKTSGEPSGGTIVRQDAQTMTISAQISQTPNENHIGTSAADKNTGEPASEAPSEEASQDDEESTTTPPSEPVSNSPEMSQEASVSTNKQIPTETKPADSTSKSVLQAQKDETQAPEKAPPISPAAPSEPVDIKVASLEHSPTEEVDSGISKDGEALQADADKEETKALIPEQSLPELSMSVPDQLGIQNSDTLRSILMSPEKSAALKSSTLRSTFSVSFDTKIITQEASEDEQSSDGSYTPPSTPQEPLSATLTLEDAQNMLKSSSLYSLGSLLRGESEYASTVEVSGSEDEDFPDLDRKISQIHTEVGIPPSSSETQVPSLSQLSPGRPPSRISQDVTHMADDIIDITPIGSEVGQGLDAVSDAEDTDTPGEASSHEDGHTSGSNTHEEPRQDVSAAISQSAGRTDSQSSSSSLTSVSTSSINSSNEDVDQ